MRAEATPEQIKELHVLDHGFVRLIDSMGSDLSVVRAARVSYNAEWRIGQDAGSDTRLINYLWKNKHTSPFEAVQFTFEIQAPIFVLRQWHRHRTWSFNEVSARYTELPEVYYVPKPEEIGEQSKSSKQARVLTQEPVDMLIPSMMDHAMAAAFEAYRLLLKRGVPRELARSVLPLATYSRMFATVDLHNLLRFLTLRTHPHAQLEIRVYAEAMRELARTIVPTCITVLDQTNQSAN